MVLSEALKPAPEEAVPWLAEQNRDAVFTNGNYSCRNPVWVLTPGKCRSLLHAAVERLLIHELRGRILPLDAASVLVYPKIVTERMRIGRPLSQFDAVIASVCRARGATRLSAKGVSSAEPTRVIPC
jgi:predicted nucleic acid-binding protein